MIVINYDSLSASISLTLWSEIASNSLNKDVPSEKLALLHPIDLGQGEPPGLSSS